MTSVLTTAEYNRLRYEIDRYTRERGDCRSCTQEESQGAAVRAGLSRPPTNEERGRVEQYEFWHDAPEKYVAYVDGDKIITFTGDMLGEIRWRGEKFGDNFGGQRVNIRVYGICGFNYSGTYYPSAGTYCRLKRVKD